MKFNMNQGKIIIVLSDGCPESLKVYYQFRNKKDLQELDDQTISVFEIKNCEHEKQELFRAENCFQVWLKEKEKTYYVFTYSQIVFNYFRIMVKEKKLKPEQLQILWIDFDNLRETEQVMQTELSVDQDGFLPHWPVDMFRISDDLLSMLL